MSESVGTASAEASAKPAHHASLGAVLGRYRIEGELGSGSMGVVHAAFDPDLERRVALKVLRSATATREARERLMREARAMARLAHPNVVTVHEIGTAGGRDFVAMELIHGETLAAWLRAAPRTRAAILEAFLAAGRGLAAAHAAGVVHRDFKPNNVMRSRGGRIVVTDFGLAREAEDGLPSAFDATWPVDPAAEEQVAHPLAGVTATGALVGTPPYMAPEQWSGGAITPASDQFAYCVALWEAFSGERPYRGRSRDELRRQVVRGPAALDASRIPRRLRGVLRRGLHPDPARRWATMEALLGQIVRAQRRVGVTIAVAAAAVLVAAAVSLVAMRGGEASPGCEAPGRDLATVWSSGIAGGVHDRSGGAHAELLGRAFADWQAARTAACSAPAKVRSAQLQCLDGALEHFDAVRRAYLRVPDASDALQAQLIAPSICRRDSTADLPRLSLVATPSVVAAYALLGRSDTEHKASDAELAALSDASPAEPCARVIAALAFGASSKDLARARTVLADAGAAADQCGDERLRADLRIQDIRFHFELPIVGPKGEAAIVQAQSAAARVMQPELEAALARHRAVVAHQRGRWDEAFQWIEHELAGYRARGLLLGQVDAAILRNYLRLGRAEPRDLAAVAGDVQTWRAAALARHQRELARQLDVLAAQARFRLGEVAASHAALIELWRAQPGAEGPRGARKVTGDVVDARGRPVAGATVAAGSALLADSSGIGLPSFLPYEDFQDLDLRTATSDATGHFVIEDAASAGAITAQLGDRRSAAIAIADHVTLVLQATRSVSGTVLLGSMSHTQVAVRAVAARAPGNRVILVAPVAPDGSFTLAAAPIGALRIGVAIQGSREYDQRIDLQLLPASPSPVTGLRLVVASSGRTVDVIVRSALTIPLQGASVTLVPGHHTIRRFGDFARLKLDGLQSSLATPTTAASASPSIAGRVRDGDLLVHMEHASAGELTVCGAGFDDLLDPDSRHLSAANLARIAITCVPVDGATDVVELVVPPRPRFEER